ncbi:MAG: hypothetical protein FJ220_03370, partial [Kiritimatiellaceae bacterium]|nr:hypothetical protein [Kiritimatiellaceae bacterium]
KSTIELRFSEFLWVKDLSEPENLLAGMIPLVGSLNLLPLIMTATTIWQMKITPSTGGDPQQQKMMMVMMPIMMLVFMYTMPSGLVLYMTTSNIISIAQMMVKKVKRA